MLEGKTKCLNNRCDKKLKERNKSSSYDNIISYNNLSRSFYKCEKGIKWKYQVQRYRMNIVRNTVKLHDDLKDRKYKTLPLKQFDIYERGKKRHIGSVDIRDRCIQKSFTDNVLRPTLCPSLIPTNTASQKGKGVYKALKYCSQDLNDYFHENGNNEGYALVCDLHNFYGSIDHNEVKNILERYCIDKDTVSLGMKFIEQSGKVGLMLGGEPAQPIAISVPNKIDHYIKEVLKIRHYGRYMDDFYLIHKSKEFLERCLVLITEKFKEIKIEMNLKVTKIYKLSEGFKFLKTRFQLKDNGKIVKRLTRDNVVHEKRRLKKLYGIMNKGIISYDDACISYNSWMGYAEHKTCYRTRMSIKNLFYELFICPKYRIKEEDYVPVA